MEESVIPLFPMIKEKKGEAKNMEESEASQPLLKKDPGLHDPLLFSLDNRGQCGLKNKQLLEESQADITNNASPFIQAPVNMINLTWAEKGKGRATWEVKAERRPSDRPTEGAIKLLEKPKAATIKGVVLCSQCQCEWEL